MKVLVILGSPRKRRSSSYNVAQSFIKGMKKSGAEVDEVILAEKKINHCLGCYTCWTKTPGVCIHKDDMPEILAKISNSDLIVYVFPLYVYSVPGIFKDFLDRRIPLVEPYLVKRGDVTSHPKRKAGKQSRMFLISVSGFPEYSHFDAVTEMFKKLEHISGNDIIGKIYIPGAEPISRDELRDSFSELFNAVEKAGEEVCKYGKITPQTEDRILELSERTPEQIEQFRTVSNQYWESQMKKPADTLRKNLKTNAQALNISNGGTASFMAGMALKYRADLMPDFEAAINFRFEDESYHLIIHDGKCRAYKGEYADADMTLISPKKVWMDISAGKLEAPQAFLDGMYRIDGDMNILMNMNKIFGGKNYNKGEKKDNNVKPVDKKDETGRGPLKLASRIWITVAFLPWTVYWIWNSIAPGILPRITALSISTVLMIYHLISNRPTLFETASFIYMFLSLGLFLSGWEFFIKHAMIIDYMFLAGLWFCSLLTRYALTGEYTKHDYPKELREGYVFRKTNMLISAVWGLYFLFCALFNLIKFDGFGTNTVWIIIVYGLLAVMFVITQRLQRWYPERFIKAENTV